MLAGKDMLLMDALAAVLRESSTFLVGGVFSNASDVKANLPALQPDLIVADGELATELRGTSVPVVDLKDVRPRRASSLLRAARDAVSSKLGVSESSVALSPRELTVAALVASGFGNRDIASKLGLTEQTIKNTVSKILKKFGYTNRVQIALGALGPEGPGTDS